MTPKNQIKKSHEEQSVLTVYNIIPSLNAHEKGGIEKHCEKRRKGKGD